MGKRPHTHSSPWSITGFLSSPAIKETKAVCMSSDTSQLSQLLVVRALIWVTATLWCLVDCFLDDICALLIGLAARAADKCWSESNLSQTEAIFPDAQADKGKHEMLLKETKLSLFLFLQQLPPVTLLKFLLWPRCKKSGGPCLKAECTAWKTWAKTSVFYTEPVAKAR